MKIARINVILWLLIVIGATLSWADSEIDSIYALLLVSSNSVNSPKRAIDDGLVRKGIVFHKLRIKIHTRKSFAIVFALYPLCYSEKSMSTMLCDVFLGCLHESL